MPIRMEPQFCLRWTYLDQMCQHQNHLCHFGPNLTDSLLHLLTSHSPSPVRVCPHRPGIKPVADPFCPLDPILIGVALALLPRLCSAPGPVARSTPCRSSSCSTRPLASSYHRPHCCRCLRFRDNLAARRESAVSRPTRLARRHPLQLGEVAPFVLAVCAGPSWSWWVVADARLHALRTEL